MEGASEQLANRADPMWERVARLWDRATGGRDVAARPGDGVSGPWKDSPRPPGMDASFRWFSEQISSDKPTQSALFLVGGPGSGKSRAAASFVEEHCHERDMPSALAHRKYSYKVGDSNLLLINDATITDSATPSTQLVTELTQALADTHHVICCVNRGVLVEELAAHRRFEEPTSAGAAIVSWLHSTKEDGHASGSWTIEVNSRSNFVSTASLYEDGTLRSVMCAVFADTCSLLEESPEIEFRVDELGGLVAEFTPYDIAAFEEREVSSLIGIPAAVLLDNILRQIGAPPEPDEYNPLVANLHSLQNQHVRAGLLNVIRASEIAGGRRMTYRELWGTFVRAIVGDLPSKVEASSAAAYCAQLTHAEGPPTSFSALQERASLRFSQAMFGGTQDVKGSGNRGIQDQIVKMFRPIDPCRDVVAGSTSRPWVDLIFSAFTGASLGSSPLNDLKGNLSENDPFRLAVNAFDEALDKKYVDAMAEKSVSAQRQITAWYGQYLTRLYALAHGIPAFMDEVSAWTTAWRMAPEVPPTMKKQLLTLIQPVSRETDGGTSLIPLFDSRVVPIRGSTRSKFVLAAGKLDLVSETDGELLFLHLQEDARTVGKINLDFALVRESLAASSGEAGITDLAGTTAPRLERFRAARLAPDNLDNKHFRVVKGERQWSLKAPRKQG